MLSQATRRQIVERHTLEYRFGEGSPVARLYELGGADSAARRWIRGLHRLHPAEHRAAFAAKKLVTNGAPVIVDGQRQWVRSPDIDEGDGDLPVPGNDFEAGTELVRRQSVGMADARLIPLRELIDYAVSWMERSRTPGRGLVSFPERGTAAVQRTASPTLAGGCR